MKKSLTFFILILLVSNLFVPAISKEQTILSGKVFKFLNTRYGQLTIIVEDLDGKPLNNKWVISKAFPGEKPQALIFNGEKIRINSDQKIKAVMPNGFELQRYGFELDIDPQDDSYVWIVR